MKKYFFLLFLLFISEALLCQTVIINGINKNRLLTWDDFTGRPDKNSSYAAYTYWNVSYNYKKVIYNADTARIIEPEVTLELNNELSWVKPGWETPGLLKHEQGHFNIGLLCQHELIAQFRNTVFTRTDFRDKVQLIFKTILDKHTAMGKKYDEETNHGKNMESQQSWNEFFAGKLKAPDSL